MTIWALRITGAINRVNHITHELNDFVFVEGAQLLD